MKRKKQVWFVAITYSDEETDIAKTDDYEKAVLLAHDTWRDECEQWRKTKVQGVLCVELFDSSGRVLWDSTAEPSGMHQSANFDLFQKSGRGTGPALGPV